MNFDRFHVLGQFIGQNGETCGFVKGLCDSLGGVDYWDSSCRLHMEGLRGHGIGLTGNGAYGVKSGSFEL